MTTRWRCVRVLLLVAALVALAACSRQEPVEPSAAPRPPARVRVEAVTPRTVAETVEAVGTVRSWKQSALSSRIVAVVRAVHVREGDRAAAGQALVELDDREVAARLRHAEAALVESRGARDEARTAIAAADSAVEAALAQRELAEATWKRYRRLVEQELVAVQAYEEVAARHRIAIADAARAQETRVALRARLAQTEAAVARAEADVDNARVTAGDAIIRAPTAVIVVARTVEVGNLAAPGTVLLTVEEERYRLEATVQESELPRLRLGARATVTIDALGARPSTATVTEIVPAADPLSRTFVVKLDLAGVSGLRSGVYGRARFEVGRRPALTVPRAAVAERGQLEALFVVDERDEATLRLVKTGKSFDDRVEILAGLTPGERVVVEGVGGLSDGQRLDIAP
jgi:multidrug efflux pump subunit AcrA (membrane-fusion protein)